MPSKIISCISDEKVFQYKDNSKKRLPLKWVNYRLFQIALDRNFEIQFSICYLKIYN